MKIAFAGAGYINNIHAQAAKEQKDVELVAVVDRFPDTAKVLAKKFNCKHQFESVEQLLEMVSCGCTGGRHSELFTRLPNHRCSEAGVHVMVEKPMAMNAQEASSNAGSQPKIWRAFNGRTLLAL